MSTPHKTVSQRTGRSPNSNGKPAEIKLQIPSVWEAEKALAAHEATRPLRPRPWASKRSWDEYRLWSDAHLKLNTALVMAKSAESNHWKIIFQAEPDPEKQKKAKVEKIPRQSQKISQEDRISEYESIAMRMAGMIPQSPEWRALLERANRILRVMREYGFDTSQLPTLPGRDMAKVRANDSRWCGGGQTK